MGLQSQCELWDIAGPRFLGVFSNNAIAIPIYVVHRFILFSVIAKILSFILDASFIECMHYLLHAFKLFVVSYGTPIRELWDRIKLHFDIAYLST